MAALPGPPPGLNLKESKVPSLVSSFVITWILAVVAVVLRIVSRRLTNNKLWLDDWLAIVSLIFSAGLLFVVTCYMIGKGSFGKHVWVTPSDSVEIYFLGLFIAEYFYTISIVLVKWSLLAFYWRIFSAKRATRWPIYILSGIVCAWGIAVVLVSTFQCQPVSAFWLRFDVELGLSPSDYSCPVDVQNFFIANAIPNIITDFLILLIPVPTIWTLKLRTAQKLALVGVFALGLFVTAVSFIRLHYILDVNFNDPDTTWLFSDELMWTGIETNVATVCACLPSLKPLLNMAMHGNPFNSSARGTSEATGGSATVGSSGNGRKWGRLNPPSISTATAYVSSKGQHQEDTHPLSALTDNESDFWAGGRDIEMDHMSDKSRGRSNTATQRLNQVTITRTVGVDIDYTPK